MNPTFFEIFYQVFLGLTLSIGQVFILIISIYYLIKIGVKTDSVLLFIGSITLILNVILTHIGILHVQLWGTESYLLYTYCIQGIYFLGNILFIIGFFLVIKKVIKNKEI